MKKFLNNKLKKKKKIMKIGLVDFHKLPEEGINEYTLNIANALKKIDNSLDIIIKKIYDKDPQERRKNKNLDIFPYDAVLFSGSDYKGSHESIFLEDVVKNIVYKAIEQKKNILGICSGLQLLARVYGFKVDYLSNPEADWYNMKLKKLAKNIPLFDGIPDTFYGFSTHAKHVIVDGRYDEMVLAENENCVQAMLFYANEKYSCYIIGSQIHLEDDENTSKDYIKEYDEKKKGLPIPGINKLEEIKKGNIIIPKKIYGLIILEKWLDIVKKNSLYHSYNTLPKQIFQQ